MAKKELHYFGKDLRTKLKLSEAEYLKNFASGAGKKIIGEASVWYLFSNKAAEEIRKFAPDAKILIMLRNPVDVIYSLHSQHLYDGNENVLDFETALKLDEQRKNGLSLPDAVDYFALPPYKDSVLFSNQVKRYFDIFDKRNIRIILYEDFITNTGKEVSETLEFLGLSNKSQIEYSVVNSNKRIKWFYLHRLMKNPPLRLKRMARFTMPSRKIRHFMMSRFFKWNVQRGRRDKIGEDLSGRLKDFFKDDIQSLSKIINRDLSAWLQ